MAKRKDYVCNQCDYTTTRKFNMERHARVHENEMYSNRSIQEANQIEHVHHHEPLPSVQHGTGVVREQDNQAYNKVVEIANSWKNVCEKLQEEKLAKDNAIQIRDAHLFDQNNKIQEEFNKNKNLYLENNILRVNNANMHEEYNNALEKIQHLEIINKDIILDRDEKIVAMGEDTVSVCNNGKKCIKVEEESL